MNKLIILFLVTITGCSYNHPIDGAKMDYRADFDKFDDNKDGLIQRSEYYKHNHEPWVDFEFGCVNVDYNNIITLEEFKRDGECRVD